MRGDGVCVCVLMMVCLYNVPTATAGSNNRLALIIAIALILIHQQRVALTLAGLGAHSTGSGGENRCNQHKGGHNCHGDDFSQGERLTWR